MFKKFPYKIGYIALNNNKKLSVYLNKYTIFFRYKGRNVNILSSTKRNGFTNDYIHSMINSFFPEKYVKNNSPVIAEGTFVNNKFNLLKIMFPY